MRTLLGKKLRIVAMPQKPFGKNVRIQDWRAVLAMDGSVCLRDVLSSGIRIRECGSEEVTQLGLQTGTLSDSSRSLLFEIELNRDILASYLHHTRKLIEKQSSEPAVRKDRELRGVVFAGELSRAFKHKVLMLIIAAHVADPRNLSLNSIFSDDFQGRFGTETFSMPFIPDPRAVELDLKSHGAHEVFRFIEDGPHDTADVPTCQLMKGLTYLSHTFRTPFAGEALTSFVWALAAIEAMLSTHADKANVTMLEMRLKALLGDSFTDVLSGRFREIYKYRNALLHGNVSLPFSFDSRSVFGYRGVKNSNTMPFEFSQFTYGLALKIMQRFFELGSYDIGYRLDVATKPSQN
jgi:hypothetical protein